METFRKSAGWALIIRGLLFSLFGFLVLFMESKTIYGPMNFLGIILLVSGGLYFLLSIMLRKSSKAWVFGLFWGLVDLLTGGYIMLNMAKATDLFTDIIGIFAIIMGAAILLSAFFIKGYRIFLYINSIVSISFGFLILTNPTLGRLDFLVGLYGLLLGMFVIYGGYSLLSWKSKEKPEEKTMGINED
ncbi:MAG: DUF308 domain-containing protein [Bacteroidia bacterium]|nr:DUF308 domain-containing protein [Bacteroidia bacterium]MCF8447626.1 DUF308 domain-containing protein [Bacteroidia bacterium]